MQTRIRKWGNSLGLRIPKALAEAAGVAEGSEVEMSIRHGDLVMKPARPRRIPLEELLRGVTPGNRHDEVDAGGPVGREAL